MKKWNAASVRAAKGVEKLGCCTAYDACFARLADEAAAAISAYRAEVASRAYPDASFTY